MVGHNSLPRFLRVEEEEPIRTPWNPITKGAHLRASSNSTTCFQAMRCRRRKGRRWSSQMRFVCSHVNSLVRQPTNTELGVAVITEVEVVTDANDSCDQCIASTVSYSWSCRNQAIFAFSSHQDGKGFAAGTESRYGWQPMAGHCGYWLKRGTHIRY